MEVIFSGFKYFAILAVANFANINSNEYFCPVGYDRKVLYARLMVECFTCSLASCLIINNLFSASHQSYSLAFGMQ